MLVIVDVLSYDEGNDSFRVSFYDAVRGQCQADVDALTFPFIVRKFGSPDEFVGKSFDVVFA